MKITNRQLKRIIREAIHNPGDDALIDALTFGWAQWADDNGQPDPGLFAVEEKGDAALEWVSKNEPDIARQINALSTHKLKALYDAAFDPDADRGHKTSAMDWNR